MSATVEDSHRDRLRNGAHLVLLIVLVTAALLRLPGLNHLPPPLNQDEASRLYDAWSLLETGTDRHGDAWPMFLKSFGEGDYTASLTTILTIPFVSMLGPTQWAVRLPDALCGVVTIWLVFLLIRRMIG
ncbi:MAG: hypothetical protein IPK83_24210, partial [Planctomycetes bacterium]|nr:hypothetical protein [Planctomycetota bacterium]